MLGNIYDHKNATVLQYIFKNKLPPQKKIKQVQLFYGILMIQDNSLKKICVRHFLPAIEIFFLAYCGILCNVQFAGRQFTSATH